MNKLIALHVVQNRVFSYATIEKEEVREFLKRVSAYLPCPITMTQIRELETNMTSVALDDGSQVNIVSINV